MDGRPPERRNGERPERQRGRQVDGNLNVVGELLRVVSDPRRQCLHREWRHLHVAGQWQERWPFVASDVRRLP